MLQGSAVQVGTSATPLAVAQGMTNRWVVVQNLGPNDIWVGPANVTALTGLKVAPTDVAFFDRFDGALHAVASTAAQVSPADTRVLLDTD